MLLFSVAVIALLPQNKEAALLTAAGAFSSWLEMRERAGAKNFVTWTELTHDVDSCLLM